MRSRFIKNGELFLYEHRYILGESKKKNKKSFCKKINKSLAIDDIGNWKNKFARAILSDLRIKSMAKEFFESDIVTVRDIEVGQDDLIAICVEKNDLIRLKRFIEYHRKLGIDKFVILDNDSNDGTLEYLKKQRDVVIMTTKTKYTSERRMAWINRIFAHYGYDRWYFVADSDELLAYEDCERKSIKELIKVYKRDGVVRGRALLLDMYAKADYYKNGDTGKFYEKCVFFDKDTYYKHNDRRFDSYMGGPRERVFGFAPCVTKYPLVYFRRKDIYLYSHFLYPYKDNFGDGCRLALKHYKFLPGEKKKIERAVKERNYYNNSKQYKHYLEVMNNGGIDFWCDGTCKYDRSSALSKIDIMNKVGWEKY